MFSFPKRANFECYPGTDFPDKSIQKFGHNFEAKGNFTFSWELAIHESDHNYLCGPYYFIVKELTKRLQFNAIPFYVNQSHSTKLDLDLYGDAVFIEKLLEKELDLFINFGDITNKMSDLGQMSVPSTTHEPLVTILGSKYPNLEKDHYYAVMGIFDSKTWVLIFAWALILTTTASLIKSLNPRNSDLSSWYNEMWNIFKIICFRNFKPKLNITSLCFNYCLIYLSSVFLLNCFSSLILSQTIKSDFTIIDDLDELLARKDIKPYALFYKGSMEKTLMFGSENVKSIVRRSIDNNAVQTNADIINTAMNAFELRALLKTHCILASAYLNNLLKGHDNNIYYGKEKYFFVVSSMFYSKDTRPILFNTMERLAFDISESGLRRMWMVEALKFGWEVMADKQIVQTETQKVFSLSNFKIVSGPLIFGYIISFFILLLEMNF